MWARLFPPQEKPCDKSHSTEQLAIRCNWNQLCIHWALIIGAKDLHTASFSWPDLKHMAASDTLPKLALQGGSLVTTSRGNYTRRDNQLSQLHLELIDARTTAVRTDLVVRALNEQNAWLAQVGKAILLSNGIVYTGASPCMTPSPEADGLSLPASHALRPQLTVLDLSGGCCRALPPLGATAALRAGLSPGRQPAVRKLGELVDEAMHATEHEWIYTCMQSHGSTYFHGLAEGAPRVLWGVQLLRSNPQVRVLSSAKSVRILLDVLRLPGRAMAFDGRAMYARKVTIPQYGGAAFNHDRLLWDAFLRAVRVEVARQASPSPGAGQLQLPQQSGASHSLLVVRRSAAVKKNGRAMLNHDEVMSVVRHILSPSKMVTPQMPLVEWPAAATLQEAAITWGEAHLVIAPHGAGGTNIIFMPGGSTYVEILASDQRGRVYGTLAHALGVRYVSCVYDRNDPRFRPVLADRMVNDNFVVDVRWLLRCMRTQLNVTRGHKDSPLTKLSWSAIDNLLADHPPRVKSRMKPKNKAHRKHAA